MELPVRNDRRHDHQDAPDSLLPQVGRTIWDNTPVLLVGSLLVSAAAAPGLVLATGSWWALGWPVLVLGAGSVWAGIVAVAGRLLDGDGVTLAGLLRDVRRHAGAGTRIAVVPAVVGGILFGTLEALDRTPDAGWLAAALLLDAGGAIVVATSLVSVFTLAVERGLAGRRLWLASAGVTITRPAPVLGTVTLAMMTAWIAMVAGPVALVLIAPLAVLGAAVSRHALARARSPGGLDSR